MVMIYDCEVFTKDWFFVICIPEERRVVKFHNDPDGFRTFFKVHSQDIWVGYNNTHYDQYIAKAIVLGIDPKEVSDCIIKWNLSPFDINPELLRVQMPNYDIMERGDPSLKAFEGMMGHSIHETEVDFDIKRSLTPEEIDQTFSYCENDVAETFELFLSRKSDFHAQVELIDRYKLPIYYLARTKVSLSAEILLAEKKFRHYSDRESELPRCLDEFDIQLPSCIKIKKYKHVVDWFSDPMNHTYTLGSGKNQLVTCIAGLEFTFGWGGVHASRNNYHSKGYFVNMDVASLYPSIMLNWPDVCMSRAIPEEGRRRYKEILKTRFDLKKAGKKKEQAPFKIILNGSYGGTKDKYNKMYDPRAANNVVVYGQLLVGVDLVEKLESVCEIIQVNTDGVLVKLNSYDDYELIDDIAYEWEKRTGLSLDFDDYGYGELFQKDVSNYLIKSEFGFVKGKGSYVKDLSEIDYDLPIVNKALRNYMQNGIPVEDTIMKCDEMREFQQIRKISSKYEGIFQNCKREGRTESSMRFVPGQLIPERCIRIYASRDESDGTFCKKHINGSLQKMASTPIHAFCENGDVRNMKCPQKLDKRWYVSLAKERLGMYGVVV